MLWENALRAFSHSILSPNARRSRANTRLENKGAGKYATSADVVYSKLLKNIVTTG
jgi:hypothetical protein